jgi:hypothetical protein
MKVRRQVYELTPNDLVEHPIWEFALDEESEDGQDEATVRPWPGVPPLDPSDGMFVVQASLVLADGTRHRGYLTPPVQGESSIGTVQPIIVTDEGLFSFWHGAGIPVEDTIRRVYAVLGRRAEQVFPIRYSSEVELVGGPIVGSVSGFMHFRSLTDRTVVATR